MMSFDMILAKLKAVGAAKAVAKAKDVSEEEGETSSDEEQQPAANTAKAGAASKAKSATAAAAEESSKPAAKKQKKAEKVGGRLCSRFEHGRLFCGCVHGDR